MTGNDYRRWIGNYIVSAYGARGLVVYEEVQLGTSIIGKQRRIDLLVIGPEQQALVVECKYQDSAGTADEKIPYALNDMAALRLPGVLVYAGAGFSPGVLHLLQGSEFGAYCLPEPGQTTPVSRRGGAMDSGTWQFDHIVAQTFRFWDIVLGEKKPLRSNPQLTLPVPDNLTTPLLARVSSAAQPAPLLKNGASTFGAALPASETIAAVAPAVNPAVLNPVMLNPAAADPAAQNPAAASPAVVTPAAAAPTAVTRGGRRRAQTS